MLHPWEFPGETQMNKQGKLENKALQTSKNGIQKHTF